MAARSPRALAAVLLVAGMLVLGGCSTWPKGSLPMTRALGGATDDLDPPSLALAARRTAEALERGEERSVAIAGTEVPSTVLAASARHVAAVAAGERDARRLTRRLARDCRAWPAAEPAKVTAYYEPSLVARRRRDPRFRYPLFAPPTAAQLEELKGRLGRVPTRGDIDGRGVLDGLGLEVAWVDDPVSRFFLQVQGSGRLVFEDGTETRVGYAGTNDYPYVSVGARMLELGLLEKGKASATAMKRWLREHPSRRDELLFSNPRYVFFRDNGKEGPVGALGATLVAGRSVATDDAFLPRGALLWLRTTRPVVDDQGTLVAKRPLERFVFAQDAGAAIRGDARIDVFWGSGERAGLVAGGMNEAGEVYVLLCRRPRRMPSRTAAEASWWRRSRPRPHAMPRSR